MDNRWYWLTAVLVVVLLFMIQNRKTENMDDERRINLLKMMKDCNIEQMKYNIEDKGTDEPNVYTCCYDKNKPELAKFCGPDWSLVSWPSAGIESFEETTKQIVKEGNNEPLIDKVGWRGNIDTHFTRPLLKNIGDQNKDICDFDHIEGSKIKTDERAMTLPELVKTYKYLVDIGGIGFSGRLPYLLFSNRPLLLVDRDYVQYFYTDLEPYVHYVPVKQDLSDFIEKVKWLRNNEEKCKEIAVNAQKFALERFTYENILDKVKEVYKNFTSI